MCYNTLKTKQRMIRNEFPDALGLRVHRALSWLNKAEQSLDDKDSQFIFLWIAFNAAYAQDISQSIKQCETSHFCKFVNKLVELDSDNVLYNIVWQEFTTSIRLLLDNQFVFQPFWNSVSGKISEDAWRAQFKNANRAANKALGKQNTSKVLSIVLQRLYTLRNQLVHGGATWQSSANRDQVRDGAAFLNSMVPAIIDIMMNNPNTLWGDASYPVI